MVNMSPTILTRTDKRSNTITQSLYFKSLSMPCLNHYHDLFYLNIIKFITKNLSGLLTTRGLGFGSCMMVVDTIMVKQYYTRDLLLLKM